MHSVVPVLFEMWFRRRCDRGWLRHFWLFYFGGFFARIDFRSFFRGVFFVFVPILLKFLELFVDQDIFDIFIFFSQVWTSVFYFSLREGFIFFLFSPGIFNYFLRLILLVVFFWLLEKRMRPLRIPLFKLFFRSIFFSSCLRCALGSFRPGDFVARY